MTAIRSVAVFGASGNIGSAVIPTLVSADLSVTAVTRPGSSHTFPSGVKFVSTDYTLESLQRVLQDADAVVSLVGPQGFTSQHAIIDAAVASGVRYFIPSEFGHDYTDPRILNLIPAFKVKNEVVEHLKSVEEKEMSWTGVITGLWFDWGLPFNMFDVNLRMHKAKIWDGGSTTFRAANVRDIAQAVTTLLLNPEVRAKARNKNVYVSSVKMTQNELLAVAEKVTGKKFEVEHVDTETVWPDLEAKARQRDGDAIKGLLTGISVSKKGLGQFGEKADEWDGVLLGGEREGVEDVVRRIVKGEGREGKWVTQD